MLILPRFADRDLMMRFRGGGVGHKSTRAATDFFKQDRDRLDTNVTTEMTSIFKLDDDVAKEILNDEPDDDGNSIVDEEEDYGYVRDDSESEDTGAEGVEVGQDGQDDSDVSDQDLGLEDDTEAIDALGEFGYADL
jgi:hypothetical protein